MNAKPVTIADFLRERFEESSRQNPRFSLRAYARKLGLAPGSLSQIMSRKKKLSVSRAHEVARSLGLAKQDREKFILLAEIEGARTSVHQVELRERLLKMAPESGAHSLDVDQFRMMSEWYGPALLVVIARMGTQWSVQQMASLLGISKLHADAMIERLIRLELVERAPDGKGLQRVVDRVMIRAKAPSEAIQNYYLSIVDKARDSVTEQAPAEKVVGAEVLSFDVSQIEEVRRLTDEYFDKVVALSNSGKQKDQVYQLWVDFFRLSQKNKRMK